ncbi:MAG: Vms1/Ankzf1 family peptidyl-tRNA hydrolase [Candidatus Nanohaloarchaea archaeon]
MKFPWNNEEKVNELEEKINELEEERDKFKEKFEAEKRRRKKLSREKQSAEEEKNRLQDKVRSLKDKEAEDNVESEGNFETISINLDEFLDVLNKLDSVKSDSKDLVTVWQSKYSNISDKKGLKNSVSLDQLKALKKNDNVLGFFGETAFDLLFHLNGFNQDKWFLDDKFHVGEIINFIEEEKIWVLCSIGEAKIFRESGGDYEEIERINTRIEESHSSGGFSQDRFERLRDKQINEYKQKVNEKLKNFDNIYLLGAQQICKDLKGRHVSGFDRNRDLPEKFYEPSLKEF